MDDNSARYVATPFTMYFPAIPILTDGALPNPKQDLLIQGVETLPGCIGVADRRTQALLRKCKKRVANDPSAILQLLEDNPELIADEWVRDRLLRLAKAGRLRRSRGRPRGRFTMHPLLVVGMVEQLLSSGQARRREQAFGLLGDFGVSYETAKCLFYQALREKRFRALLLTFPKLAREITADEFALLRSTDVLRSGESIIRTVKDSRLEQVEVTFNAEES